MAPLYDTVPTALFDRLPDRCAMTINSVFEDLARVTHDDLVAEMAGKRRRGLPSAVVDDLESAVCAEAAEAVREVGVPSALTDHVTRRAVELAD